MRHRARTGKGGPVTSGWSDLPFSPARKPYGVFSMEKRKGTLQNGSLLVPLSFQQPRSRSSVRTCAAA